MKEARVSIIYCTKCNWLLRSGWLAQELLQTFQNELTGVSLHPGDSGVFEIRVNDELIWSFAAERHFPEAKELKQLVRDRIAPGRDLGHSDAPVKESSDE